MTHHQIKTLVQGIYEARRDRQVNPEGRFDGGGRWYPSDAEDADGDGSRTRSPSRAWPYSYMLRCRTRQHVRVLVERALAGQTVSSDVASAVCAAVAASIEIVQVAA
jgi:hypothetical protein